MRVMSYNIWSQVEREPRWAARRELVANVLRSQRVDIVGFQEATRAMIEDLEKLLPTAQFRFRRCKILQPCFPFLFQAAGNQSVFRVYGFVLALGTFCLVTGTFAFQAPLR